MEGQRWQWTGPLILLALLVGGCCGKEVGRLPFASPGSARSTMNLQAGEVTFWTDIHFEYEGEASLQYTVQLQQGGAVVASATCNPLGRMAVKTSWVETNVGDSHSRRGTGKMGCTATLPAAGATQVDATLAFGTTPPKHRLTKADLIVKQ